MNKNIQYLLIAALVVAELVVISLHADRLAQAPTWFWLLAGFATMRAARTVSFNAIGAPIRAPFTVTEPDGSGAGDTVNPKPGSVIGELLACPICTGTHTAAVIVALYSLIPGAGLAAAAVFGVAGVSEILNWLACLLEWRGHAAREETGRMVRERERSKTRVNPDALQAFVNASPLNGVDASGWKSEHKNGGR
jgi:hypothetical protein